MALKVVNGFFDRNLDKFETDAPRQKWATVALRGSWFLYTDAHSKKKTVCNLFSFVNNSMS